MEAELKRAVEQAILEISNAKSRDQIEKLGIKYLGRKKGIFTRIKKGVSSLPAEKKIGLGTLIKQSREKIEEAISRSLESEDTQDKKIHLDVTTPGKNIDTGSLHPITQIIEEVKEIFHYLGFTWSDGPEVENDVYNFQKLNIPKEHPSRDMQQTYYLENDLLLRTHTSNMQVRYMEKNKPPIRVLFPGRVYRRDMPDATHFPAFFQIEGLQVGKNIRMTNLLGALDYFARCLFGKESKIRVYGHHFPYTEPSVEVEVFHPKKGWLEILGAGMVHPSVLSAGGIDPGKYSGWAFGVGAERIAMIKYDIDDIRLLFDNDLRFLKQF